MGLDGRRARDRDRLDAHAGFHSLPAQIVSRVADIVLTTAVLLALAPLLAVIAIAVLLADPGPILFKQRRIGRDGRPFDCYKFRSMAVDASERLATLLADDSRARLEWSRHQKLTRDPRVTQLGRLLRRTSLDELPQLINVLRGDMSLVGPRPIVGAEAARYGRHFTTYCRVRPGLTGLWQISGRSDVSYRQRVVLDVAYVRAKSLRLDLRILLFTLPSILIVRGAY